MISSLLLQDIPRHDTRLFEVREAFRRTLLLGFRAYISAYFLYLGGLIDESADIMPEIKWRVRLAWACYSRFKRELYDMEAAPFALKLRMLKAEVMETLPYGCVTCRL